ncbi:ArsA family ATPase [Angustibacter luteus]|uniref:ArsA family ATPase n=1 Tax=Angustibacter luteus TaxID=658456 RepID=A0ABW1JC36_9ACTN
MRVVLFTGKGGVGKTTVAAATAVHAARSGVKTLVLSTDAAHSLGDTLGQDLPPDDVCEVEPGLWAQQVDAGRRLTQTWGAVQDYLVDVLAALDVQPLDAAELTVLPGADDVLTLLAVRDHVENGPWDLVVVDCAPTAETLRWLAVPEALTRLVDRLLPSQRALAKVLVPVVGRAAALPAPGREVGPALLRLREQLAGAMTVLRSERTSVRIVLTPESVVLAEARRTLTALALQGFVVDGAVANRVIPTHDASAWQLGWVSAQQDVLDQADESFAPLRVDRAPYQAAEPVGPDALARLGEELVGEQGMAELIDGPRPPSPVRVERLGNDFELVIDLPNVRAQDVELARREDDLLVAVDGHRRVITLPSALRRCTVAGARFTGGGLHVRFEPDPTLWPAS